MGEKGSMGCEGRVGLAADVSEEQGIPIAQTHMVQPAIVRESDSPGDDPAECTSEPASVSVGPSMQERGPEGGLVAKIVQ